MNLDSSFLRAALVGYENQLAQIEQAMAEIRRRLNKAPGAAKAPTKRPRRALSAAARKRIAAAQKKRWAAYKKAKSSKKS